MGVKNGFSHEGINIDWGCVWTGVEKNIWKWREGGEHCTIRNFI